MHFYRFKRGVVTAFLAVVMMVTSLVTTSTPAAASATWCLHTSQVKLVGITIPTGYYCFSVLGSGTRVDATTGSYNGPVIANAAERVTFYDRYGRSYASWITYSSRGNTYGFRYWRSGIHGYAKAGGSVCGEMMAAGVTIGRICHRIA